MNVSKDLSNARLALDESRTNSERLHRESELVVQNVNTWVREQKRANEKLGNKIRDQSKGIVQLSTEKDQLQEQIVLLQKENKKLMSELDEKRIDYDKFRALQSHSSHQQVLLHQLKNRLEELEGEQDVEVKQKLTAIDGLQTRLKTSVDAVQTLSQQLSSLQKEKLRLRADLERQATASQTLKLQVEGKNQLVNSLKAQLASLRGQPPYSPDSQSPQSHTPRSSSHSCSSPRCATPGLPNNQPTELSSEQLMNRALVESGIANPDAVDKNYWISRVGQLSHQLQESSEYWADKVQQLQQDQQSAPTPRATWAT
ncbi:hypothetical protein NP493_54g04036 [Ridgeia piscesae]|uniref:Uncharacterized protein n=1 Tax=Ridgeia piscesae TaxID=27915 RepID=A0AAD9PAR4_RIDPI|nr:hypothetical protein NP493_54g04036 [Ridgeia piscesae]